MAGLNNIEMLVRAEKIIDYKVIESNYSASLANEVWQQIQQGWRPHGTPMVYQNGDYPCFCQAMVRYEEREIADVE